LAPPEAIRSQGRFSFLGLRRIIASLTLASKQRGEEGFRDVGDFSDAMLISVRIAPQNLLLFQNRNLCEKELCSF
jgi:hypothetical protein